MSGLGLWIAAGLLGSVNYTGTWWVFVIAGLLLALINMVVRPILIFLAIPALLLTLGLFLIVINGLMVWLVSWLYPSFQVATFWGAMLAGLIIGLVNFLLSGILEHKKPQ